MILWTPMPMEIVMEQETLEDQAQLASMEVIYKGKSLIVELMGINQGRVLKLISSDPNDFLSDDFKPGNIINLS